MGHTPAAPKDCKIRGLTFWGSITDVFFSSSARNKCHTKHGTIVAVEVTEGCISCGVRVTIYVGMGLMDQVVRIEKGGQEVAQVYAGDKEVSLCLARLSVPQIQVLELPTL